MEKVYIVFVGSWDEGLDEASCHIQGVFKNEADAYKLRNELYLQTLEDEDEEEDEDDEARRKFDLESPYVENGHEFFEIVTENLQ
jgi:hypothetical protein